MTGGLSYRPSAFKHGYNQDDAETVIYGPLTKTYEVGAGEVGWRVLFLGFNNTPELLEVMVEYCEDEREVCFHIAKAAKENQIRYERT